MYFEKVEPMPYLDDVTTKNLLVKDGHISGIIDVDWIGMGDVLTFAALTYVALLNMGYDTDYVSFILDEMDADDIQRKAFLFYSLMYCVDFMGERGTKYRAPLKTRGNLHKFSNMLKFQYEERARIFRRRNQT